MKTLFALVALTLAWCLAPSVSDARDYGRHYGLERVRDVSRIEQARDCRQETRWENKAWEKQRGERYGKKHHRHRHVVGRPAPVRVLYRPVLVPAPVPSLKIGLPAVRVHLSW